MTSFEDYQDLAETGFSSREPIAPEDEYFHSVYISGQTRTNHINITEQAGKLQIRGVEYNLDKVNMIITNVKEVLAKVTQQNRRENLECFSYKSGQPPWFGTSGKQCGMNSAERAAEPFCSSCRSQIIVSGIYCDDSGKPVRDSEGKPIFLFIRAKGMKYSNVSQYLADMYKRDDLEPIFEPATDESKAFEKQVVNNKRFVTQITMGKQPSDYGEKDVFILNATTPLPKNVVFDVLQITKKTLDKFNEKFDWSRNRPGAQGYVNTQITQENIIPENSEDSNQSQQQTTEQPKQEEQNFFSFEDMKF